MRTKLDPVEIPGEDPISGHTRNEENLRPRPEVSNTGDSGLWGKQVRFGAKSDKPGLIEDAAKNFKSGRCECR